MSSGRHLLVTNDFPPKIGGIQNYLWELWKRLDPGTVYVLTASSDPNAQRFDEAQRATGFSIERIPRSTLFFPTKKNRRAIEEIVARVDPDVVIVDPAFPLGRVLRHVDRPGVTIVHGAELTIPRRLPFAKGELNRTMSHCAGVIAAGPYPRHQVERLGLRREPAILEIPPGVDTKRFVPLALRERLELRQALGIADDAFVVTSVSRLVPRKGMETLIQASVLAARAVPSLKVLIGGTGREEASLAKLISRSNAPVTMVGRVEDEVLPGLLGASDLFVMACRSRWGGLEEEGFGIVFLEAAAVGIPQIAGKSGGSADAVVDGETGVVLDNARDPEQLAREIVALAQDPARRTALGGAARLRAVASFDYDVLANRLREALASGWPQHEGGSPSDV